MQLPKKTSSRGNKMAGRWWGWRISQPFLKVKIRSQPIMCKKLHATNETDQNQLVLLLLSDFLGGTPQLFPIASSLGWRMQAWLSIIPNAEQGWIYPVSHRSLRCKIEVLRCEMECDSQKIAMQSDLDRAKKVVCMRFPCLHECMHLRTVFQCAIKDLRLYAISFYLSRGTRFVLLSAYAIRLSFPWFSCAPFW